MKVYVLGDSISMHYGPYLQQHLKGIIDYARKEGAEEANLNLDTPVGANGGDSQRVLEFVRAKAAKGTFGADILAVNCGLHDIKRDPSSGAYQVPLEQYKANLQALVATVAPLHEKLVWIRTTPCDEAIHNSRSSSFHRFAADAQTYNAAADQIMAAAQVPIIDLYTFTANLGPDLFCDHVHFNEAIRIQQAAFIAGWLSAHAATLR